MKHDHSHNHKNAIGIAFVLNLGFAISEFIAGLVFQSTALLSDAVHDSGDVLSLLLSAIMGRYSKKKPTKTYSYGFGRLNLLTALFNSLVLLIGSAFVIKEALIKLAQPEPVNSLGMFIMSIVGIVINFYAVLGFRGTKNILNRSVMLHLMEDLLGWIAVFVGSILIYLTGWYVLDPLLSLAISLFVVINALGNLKDSCQTIMMRTSDVKEVSSLIKDFNCLPGVLSVIDCHYWSLDGEHQILTAKLKLGPNSDQVAIRKQISDLLSPYQVSCSTIEFIPS